jgi:hypothetical protein
MLLLVTVRWHADTTYALYIPAPPSVPMATPSHQTKRRLGVPNSHPNNYGDTAFSPPDSTLCQLRHFALGIETAYLTIINAY